MKDKYYLLNDRQLVNLAVKEKGYYRKPAYYIDYIEDSFGRSVSNSTVTKTIGTYNMRKKRLYQVIEDKAKVLLYSAHNDIHICFNVLRRVYDQDKSKC